MIDVSAMSNEELSKIIAEAKAELERIWKEDKKDRIFRDEYLSIDKWIEECFKEQEIEI